MFADSQVINAVTLNRVGSGNLSGLFQSADSNYKLSLSHQYGKRTRHQVRLDNRKIAADPLATANNLNYGMSCYIVTDVPAYGYSIAEQLTMVTSLVSNLAATSNANWTKYLQGES